jgi:hypothetical protein
VSDERLFTVEEADELIPQIAPMLERLRDARRTILDAGERIEAHAVANGGGSEGKEYWEALRVVRDVAGHLATEGIILRDAESGLIDFPSERDGQPALLCWRLGEDRIGYWHPPETGFSGRRPL